MNMIPVRSSNLIAIGYDEETAIMHIRFHGNRLYEYKNVPKSVFNGLLNSRSKGQYFHQHIKGRYQDREL